MNRFDREHFAGVREGLSAAMGIIERSPDLKVAKQLVGTELRLAAEAIDRDNAGKVRDLAGASVS